jgi:predicted ATPase
MYKKDRHVEHRAFFGGHDSRVCGHGQAALANWLLGNPDESKMHIHRAVELAQDSDHKPTVAHALDYEVMLSYMMGDRDRTQRVATELYELSRMQKFPDYYDRARTFLGWCLVHEGQVSPGMKELESGLAAQRRVGTQEDSEVFRGMYAECLLQAGLVEEAAAEYQQALSLASSRSMLYWQGELSRRVGSLAHQQGDLDLSRSNLLQAISLNESQGANYLLVRALKDFIQLFPGEAADYRKMLVLIQTENPRLFELPEFQSILSLVQTGTSGTDA